MKENKGWISFIGGIVLCFLSIISVLIFTSIPTTHATDVTDAVAIFSTLAFFIGIVLIALGLWYIN